NLSTGLAMTGLSAAASARRQLITAQTALNKSEHALKLLLGLKATATLHLVGRIKAIAPDALQVQTALADLPHRRPDLLALQAGYQSQNQKLREAILKQFPAINIGFNRARDNSAVYTSGFTVGLTLPLFNRNRGNIAIARATRQRLHDNYAARLLKTRSDAHRLLQQLQTQQAALPQAATHAALLESDLQHADNAWHARQLPLATYLALRSNALAADLRLLQLRQSTAETGIALQTLLGGQWSPSAKQRLLADAPPPTASTHSSSSPK
ncbi:MAG: TolC family protein, partial [Sinobacteraceae bacterium]|nr:TolC family protein [Nevskiaceae bacterium]